jgi:hypothetical protein
MATQVAAGMAEMGLPDSLREAYGGREMFHGRGGLVVVAVTDAAKADDIAAHFRSYGVQDIEVTVTGPSAAEVERLVEELQARVLRSRPDGASRIIDVVYDDLGVITVKVAPGDLNEVEADIVRMAREQPDLYRVMPVAAVDSAREIASCDIGSTRIECNTPLRGGVVTHSPGFCTAGFIVRSNVDNRPYVLSAGHCDSAFPEYTWVTAFVDNSPHAIGRFHHSVNNTDTDAGIMAINNPTGWNVGWPLIVVSPNGGNARNETYVIERVLNPALGDRVCFTGGYSARTDCSTVTTLYGTADGVAGLFKTSGGCPEKGDSGGPVFAANTAYGISSAARTDICNGVWAEQAPEAEWWMNVHIVTG